MKILFISHYDNMYGANRALLSLILGMQESGAHQPFVTLPAEGEFTEALRKAGVPYYICDITQWQAIYKEPVSFMIKKQKRKKQIAAELELLYAHYRNVGIDVIHSNSSVIGTGAMLAEKLGCMHVWHIREFAQEHYGMEYFYPEEQVRKYYEQATCLVTISDALKEYMRAKYPSARVLRIYDGVDAAEIPERAADEGAGAKTEEGAKAEKNAKTEEIVRFVYVAYLFPKKQQLEVLQAAAELKAGGLTNFRITFAGTGLAPYEKKLREYAKKNGLSEVEFAGFVSDIPGLLAKSDVGLMASAYEGFGLVTVEYMLAGLPVIGFESGATPEIVTSETGFLYHDKEGFKDAVKRLVWDRELRRKLGEAGRRRAQECFPASANTMAIRKLYDSLQAGGL